MEALPKKRGPKPKPESERIRAYPVALTGSQIDWAELQAKHLKLNVSEFFRFLIDSLIKGKNT